MTYECINGEKDTLGFKQSLADSSEMLLSVQVGSTFRGIHIPKADVPAVALELLKEPVSDWSTQSVELVAIVASLERYVKANDSKVKLQERRDAIKTELVKAMLNRTGPTDMTQVAIDRIINLEDGK